MSEVNQGKGIVDSGIDIGNYARGFHALRGYRRGFLDLYWQDLRLANRGLAK